MLQNCYLHELIHFCHAKQMYISYMALLMDFGWFDAKRPSQQLWSCRYCQFT